MATAPVVDQFYEAFARRDAAAMAACYHPDATFEDPAFGALDRTAACAMWAMLLERSTDLLVTHRVLNQDGDTLKVQWEARYTFLRTGRPVVNRIAATFTLDNDLIRTHRDEFNFWVWARQAFGPLGFLLGWTPWFHHRVQSDTLRALASYRAKRPVQSSAL